jgi:molybdopterin synthase catalytic subunit
MAQKKLAELEAEARQRWPLTGCAIVHRVGHVDLGAASVAIAVSSPHRQAAFAAGQWLIDTLKKVVPIWKKENWADGTSQWVHPGEGRYQGSGVRGQDSEPSRLQASDSSPW